MPEHFVYRMYARETLLYVGYTAKLASRLAAHMHGSAWWPSVNRMDFARYPDRQAGLDAERQAILDEDPAHNVARYRTIGSKTPIRTFRVSDDLWSECKRRAKEEGRTVTDVILEALTEYLDEL